MDRIHPLLDKKRQVLARHYEKENRLLGLAGLAMALVSVIMATLLQEQCGSDDIKPEDKNPEALKRAGFF